MFRGNLFLLSIRKKNRMLEYFASFFFIRFASAFIKSIMLGCALMMSWRGYTGW